MKLSETERRTEVHRESLWKCQVELIGIEPTTSGLQSQRSPN